MTSEYGGYPDRYAEPAPSAGLWLGLSIAATALCCTPLGIVGIVYSAMAMDALSRGDYYLAAERVRTARTWTQWSFFLGLAVLVLAVCVAAGG
jgi:hypothetical protein